MKTEDQWLPPEKHKALMSAALQSEDIPFLTKLAQDDERSKVRDILSAVEKEVDRASRKHGPHNSAHESYGVLCEEVQEFFDEVRKQQVDKLAMRTELVQIAAVCVRAIRDLNL